MTTVTAHTVPGDRAAVPGKPFMQAARRRIRTAIPLRMIPVGPEGPFGVDPAAGAAVAAAALLLFVAIAFDVLAGGRLTMVDTRLANWLHLHASPSLTVIMRACTEMAAAPAIAVLGVLASVVLAARRSWTRFATLVMVLPGGVLINEILKLAFHRPRPHFAHPLVTLTSYSFPSGHTNAAVLFYGLMAVILTSAGRTRRCRAPAVAAAALVVLLVAFSRVYLGAHYLSDVLAAMAEGVAWLAASLTVLTVRRRGRHAPAG